MEVPHQSLPVCSHMAVVERVASVIPGSVAGEHAVPSTSFGNGHLHILMVIQGTTHTHTLQPFLKTQILCLSFMRTYICTQYLQVFRNEKDVF